MGGSAGSGGVGGAGGGPIDEGCPATGRGPAMVRVNHPDGDYCIDRTEVTKGQYKVFLDEMEGDYSGQRTECVGNTTYGFRDCNSTYYPNDNPNAPVACTDWCDADAFCRWSGKRLCGRIGGGDLRFSYESSLESEWYNACTAAGEFQPPGSCGGDASGTYLSWLEVTGTGCLGSVPPFDQVTHLVGNVREWTAECHRPILSLEDECVANGAGFTDYNRTPSRYVCTNKVSYVRFEQRNDVGIRCCAEVTP
ncbi:MAG: SUMF1/EgtB/PvdO family nonheme iron enzyme [Polyangiaceae bacterium]|nr:SUMF1/EgtB/PvdO family nonheme iron enzyme [Polyangiaceae bacterium]